MFKFISLRWLKPTQRRVNNFKPETLFPNVLLAVNQIKSKSVSNCLRQKRISKSFCSAESRSNFGTVACIIMPVWWGK